MVLGKQIQIGTTPLYHTFYIAIFTLHQRFQALRALRVLHILIIYKKKTVVRFLPPPRLKKAAKPLLTFKVASNQMAIWIIFIISSQRF